MVYQQTISFICISTFTSSNHLLHLHFCFYFTRPILHLHFCFYLAKQKYYCFRNFAILLLQLCISTFAFVFLHFCISSSNFAFQKYYFSSSTFLHFFFCFCFCIFASISTFLHFYFCISSSFSIFPISHQCPMDLRNKAPISLACEDGVGIGKCYCYGHGIGIA